MAALPQDDLTRSSSSRRSFASASFPEAWRGKPDVFGRTTSQSEREDDEEKLRWAAIERLPTYDRLRKGMLNRVLDNGEIVQGEVDVTKLGNKEKKLLMDSVLKTAQEGNEKFLQRLRDRTDRTDAEESAPGEDEDTRARVAPIVKLEEVDATTGEEDGDSILDL
ncbi:hypothetical protein RHSIM_Rhsim02G0209800 [Rhododendron simsii]|uniref:Uncharacterized protein n=1 Tax=Rhododendron simsii TaxID=118357 RepID=A0A834LUC5_RHOSS|nr:hypothetical protein RHSIM_Rhsim02G0209800 [Rhododendron simsii]